MKYDPNDPAQVKLLENLAEVAIIELTNDLLDDASAQVSLFIVGQGWSREEAQERIEAVLAASKGHLESPIYERAKLVGERAIK